MSISRSPVLTLLAVHLLAQPALAGLPRNPLDRPCGGSEAKAKQVQKDAETRAQKAFPKLRVTSRGCTCMDTPCEQQRTRLSAERLPGETEGIVFDVELQLQRTSSGPDGAHLQPVSGPQELAATARAIRSDPFVQQVFGKAKLFCRLATDANGGSAWVICAPSDWDSPMFGMSSSEDVLQTKGEAVVLTSVLNPALQLKGGPRVGEWRLEGYALAGTRVPEDALGWSAARTQPLVRAFTQEHKDFRIEFFRWHTHYVIVREGFRSPQGVTVRFENAKSWFALPGEIGTVREGTDYFKP